MRVFVANLETTQVETREVPSQWRMEFISEFGVKVPPAKIVDEWLVMKGIRKEDVKAPNN